MTAGTSVAALTEPEELYDLLDPDVMWYSVDLDSNVTCNGKDSVVACIGEGLAQGRRGRFELVSERDDFVVVQAVLDPPEPERTNALLLRFRDGLIVEMRSFATPAAALAYAVAAS
jgi:hypothetical protein